MINEMSKPPRVMGKDCTQGKFQCSGSGGTDSDQSADIRALENSIKQYGYLILAIIQCIVVIFFVVMDFVIIVTGLLFLVVLLGWSLFRSGKCYSDYTSCIFNNYLN